VAFKSDRCRANADACINQAAAAKSRNERDAFLELAKTWLRAAVRADASAFGGTASKVNRTAKTNPD